MQIVLTGVSNWDSGELISTRDVFMYLYISYSYLAIYSYLRHTAKQESFPCLTKTSPTTTALLSESTTTWLPQRRLNALSEPTVLSPFPLRIIGLLWKSQDWGIKSHHCQTNNAPRSGLILLKWIKKRLRQTQWIERKKRKKHHKLSTIFLTCVDSLFSFVNQRH